MDDLLTLIQQGEGAKTEFKPSLMFVQSCYKDSSDSGLKIFDDRIEFYNPRELYDDQTIEKLNSNQYQSKTRNKLIALIVKECGLIEKYGSGIDRIKRHCKAHCLKPPKFEEMQKGFRVTVYKEESQQRDISEKDGGVSGGVNLIYETIEKPPNLKAKQIADALNIPLRTVEREIKKLKDQDKIRFKGAPKTGGYYVK